MTTDFEILQEDADIKSRQFGDLVITFTTTFELRWNDRGSRAGRDGSFWHPIPPPGFRALGSIAAPNYDNPNGKYASLCVKPAPGKESALASPTGYAPVYYDWDSGADMIGSCWRPTPPPGYLALGDVFVSGYDAPSLEDVLCVQQNLVHPGHIAVSDIWNNRGSGADVDFACWQIEANAPSVDTPDGMFAVNSFVGTAGDGAYMPPSSSAVNWNLRLPFPSSVGDMAEKPVLTSRHRPQARTSSVVDRIVTVPFTAILDRERTLAEQVAHPFYEIRRLVDYSLVLFLKAGSGKKQEASAPISTGITPEESESCSMTLGLSITTDLGIRSEGLGRRMFASFSSALGYANTQFKAQTDEVSLSCPPRRSSAAWIESHRIRVVRSDGTSIGPDIFLNPSNTPNVIAEFPEKTQPMTKSPRTSEDGTVVERRGIPRVRLTTPLPARLGRVDGVVIDLSARGARVRHTNVIPCDGLVRLTFQWKTQQCTATAKVISSRLVSLDGEASSLPPFESRLKLVEIPHTSEHLLARVTADELGAREAAMRG